MVVDMSRVRQLSSTTVAALLWIRRCSKARRIEVVLRDTSPSIADRLQRAGLLGVLVIEPPPAASRTAGSDQTLPPLKL
jgi:anti-anti-sigma regulatory factor